MSESRFGATRSFDELFDDHFERLVRSLSVAAGSRDVAQDAVQEAFAQAHARWGRLSDYEDPVGWVRRAALHRIHNHHRGWRRFVAASDRLGRATSAAADEFERWISREDVAGALATLSARQREAVALFYLEGLTVPATAHEMGVSAGAVKTHLHRAREALRPLLEDVR